MDIKSIFTLKQSWSSFASNHPKFLEFVQAVKRKGFTEDTEISITVAYPDGQELKAGLRLKKSDAEMIEKVLSILGKK